MLYCVAMCCSALHWVAVATKRTGNNCLSIKPIRQVAMYIRQCHTLWLGAQEYTDCNKLQHPETHCNTLHHPERYCNTLQHTDTLLQTANIVTHCNIQHHHTSRQGAERVYMYSIYIYNYMCVRGYIHIYMYIFPYSSRRPLGRFSFFLCFPSC